MRAVIASIRKELTGIFRPEEIDSLIFLIFEKLKGYSRTQFILAQDEELTSEDRQKINAIVGRLVQHEPIQYILGETEFYGLTFSTIPGVLIPRPETEELVQWIIKENTISSPSILDIGTGSGCIAIALKKNIAQANVLACDISPVCIATARKNAAQNAIPVAVLEFDILKQTPPQNFPELDIIVSNPPYVRETEKMLMEKNVLNYEPGLALFVPDSDPLLFYRQIADFALVHLKNNGRLYFEINEAFGTECCTMLQGKGFSKVNLQKDMNTKDRMVGCILVRS